MEIANAQSSSLTDVVDCSPCLPRLEHHLSKLGNCYSGACVAQVLDILHSVCLALRYKEGDANRNSVLGIMGGRIAKEFGHEDL